jgi:hypothetical protein
VATAAAIIAVVINVRRPIVEGAPPWAMVAAPRTAQVASAAGLSLRIAPPTRKLSGPTSGEAGGKVNVIPVAGPVSSLALAVRPLNVPDTSLVTVALLDARGNTLFSVAHLKIPPTTVEPVKKQAPKNSGTSTKKRGGSTTASMSVEASASDDTSDSRD